MREFFSPPNVWIFHSLQVDHVRKCGISFQISPLLWQPNHNFQEASNSTTLFGITQWIPNGEKTNDHISAAIKQWIRRLISQFTRTFTHSTPVHNNYSALNMIFHCQYFTQGSMHKKYILQWNHHTPYALRRESLILLQLHEKSESQNFHYMPISNIIYPFYHPKGN